MASKLLGTREQKENKAAGTREQKLCLGNREHQNRKNAFREQRNTRKFCWEQGNMGTWTPLPSPPPGRPSHILSVCFVGVFGCSHPYWNVILTIVARCKATVVPFSVLLIAP